MTSNEPAERPAAHAPTMDQSPDRDDRVEDFLARHGGAGTRATIEETHPSGTRGSSEVFAADGYALRCDWSKMDTHEEMQFTEIAPESRT